VALRGFLEGNGQTRPVMVIALLGVALNAALNEVLIFGRLGLPRLGVAGAGVATSVTYLAMAVAAAFTISRGYRSLRVFRGWRVEGRVVRERLALGWPISLTLGFAVRLCTGTALVTGFLGAGPLAGQQRQMQAVLV